VFLHQNPVLKWTNKFTEPIAYSLQQHAIE
jgi:hypothetical protein